MADHNTLQTLQTWPAEIFLVTGYDDELMPFAEHSELTWCADQQAKVDVRYLRHDLVDQQLNALHHSIAAERLHAEQGWLRYGHANDDRNAVRAERVQLVTDLATMREDLDTARSNWEAGAEELRQADARIAELELRLEIDPSHNYDGIYCRNKTIDMLEDARVQDGARIAELETIIATARRLLAVLTCEDAAEIEMYSHGDITAQIREPFELAQEDRRQVMKTLAAELAAIGGAT